MTLILFYFLLFFFASLPSSATLVGMFHKKEPTKGARQRITAPLSEAALFNGCTTVAWAFVILLFG